MTALSGGMVRRVGLAQALVSNPDFLLLDEPTTGLDPQQRHQVRAHISQIGAEKTILLSSHIIEDILELADRILILHEGQLLMVGDKADVLSRLDATDARTFESAFVNLIANAPR